MFLGIGYTLVVLGTVLMVLGTVEICLGAVYTLMKLDVAKRAFAHWKLWCFLNLHQMKCVHFKCFTIHNPNTVNNFCYLLWDTFPCCHVSVP